MNDEQLDYRDMLFSIYNKVDGDNSMLYFDKKTPYLRRRPWSYQTRDTITTYFSNRFTVNRYLIYIQDNCFEHRLASGYIINYYDKFCLLISLILTILIDDSDFVSENVKNVSQEKEIDMLIKCANENQKYEIQTMLIDYKYKNNLFSDKRIELL